MLLVLLAAANIHAQEASSPLIKASKNLNIPAVASGIYLTSGHTAHPGGGETECAMEIPIAHYERVISKDSLFVVTLVRQVQLPPLSFDEVAYKVYERFGQPIPESINSIDGLKQYVASTYGAVLNLPTRARYDLRFGSRKSGNVYAVTCESAVGLDLGKILLGLEESGNFSIVRDM